VGCIACRIFRARAGGARILDRIYFRRPALVEDFEYRAGRVRGIIDSEKRLRRSWGRFSAHSVKEADAACPLIHRFRLLHRAASDPQLALGLLHQVHHDAFGGQTHLDRMAPIELELRRAPGPGIYFSRPRTACGPCQEASVGAQPFRSNSSGSAAPRPRRRNSDVDPASFAARRCAAVAVRAQTALTRSRIGASATLDPVRHAAGLTNGWKPRPRSSVLGSL